MPTNDDLIDVRTIGEVSAVRLRAFARVIINAKKMDSGNGFRKMECKGFLNFIRKKAARKLRELSFVGDYALKKKFIPIIASELERVNANQIAASVRKCGSGRK